MAGNDLEFLNTKCGNGKRQRMPKLKQTSSYLFRWVTFGHGFFKLCAARIKWAWEWKQRSGVRKISEPLESVYSDAISERVAISNQYTTVHLIIAHSMLSSDSCDSSEVSVVDYKQHLDILYVGGANLAISKGKITDRCIEQSSFERKPTAATWVLNDNDCSPSCRISVWPLPQYQIQLWSRSWDIGGH